VSENFRRAHLLGGTFAIVFLIWQFPNCWEQIITDWKKGSGYTASIALGGFLFGCVVGIVVNLFVALIRSSQKPK